MARHLAPLVPLLVVGGVVATAIPVATAIWWPQSFGHSAFSSTSAGPNVLPLLFMCGVILLAYVGAKKIIKYETTPNGSR